MASIKERKRRNGSVYLAEIRLKGFPPISKTFKRKTEAKYWVVQMEADLLAGRIKGSSFGKSPTLSDAIDLFLETPPPGQEHTVEDYAWMLKFWKKSLGHCLLRDLENLIDIHYLEVIILYIWHCKNNGC